MSIMTSPLALRARTVLRRTGVAAAYMQLVRRQGYEKRLAAAMRSATPLGGCVWDVGANAGHYASRFAEWVGPDGQVHAFEPAASTAARLREACATLPNVNVLPVGLSDRAATARFAPGETEDGATARVLPGVPVAGSPTVPLERGDDLAEGGLPVPDLVKIDVEGHELEVLRGMPHLLREAKLRHIFVEVHFALFEADGRASVPTEIEALLAAAGFRIGWVDQSHLHARR